VSRKAQVATYLEKEGFYSSECRSYSAKSMPQYPSIDSFIDLLCSTVDFQIAGNAEMMFFVRR